MWRVQWVTPISPTNILFSFSIKKSAVDKMTQTNNKPVSGSRQRQTPF